MVLCHPGRSVMPNTQETTVCTETATGMMIAAIAPRASRRRRLCSGDSRYPSDMAS